MNSVNEVMNELKKKGNEQTQKTYARHGLNGEMYGVKVADLKVIAKKIKGKQDLAMELYETGNCDAQYLAGMVADGAKMTKKQLETWVKTPGWHMVAEWTVPWVATESKFSTELAIKWMNSKNESIASSGWCTYSSVLACIPDEHLDKDEINGLLKRVVDEIDKSANRVRYTMNAFVIAVGSYYTPLLKEAKATAKKIGVVKVDMGDTACKVPLATAYIEKVESMGRQGKKRKNIKC